MKNTLGTILYLISFFNLRTAVLLNTTILYFREGIIYLKIKFYTKLTKSIQLQTN